jgi:hypothetical protein
MAYESSPPTRRGALLAIGASLSALASAKALLARTRASSTPKPAAAVGAAHAPEASEVELAAAAAAAEIAELMADVRPGTVLANCRVVEILPVRYGAIAVVMETRGRARFQLDVLRDDGAQKGHVASAPGLAVFVSNGGDGATRTDEEQGLSAIALGQVLERRLREGARVPTMLTLAERERHFPDAVYRA